MRTSTRTPGVVLCTDEQYGAAAARTAFGVRRAPNAVVVDVHQAGWDKLLPGGKNQPHVVFVAGARRELGQLLVAAHAVGLTRAVTILTVESGPARDGGLLAPRHPLPHVEAIRQESGRKGQKLSVEFRKRVSARSVLAAVLLEGAALPRGLGSGGLQVAVAGATAFPWGVGDARAGLVRPKVLGELPDHLGLSVDLVLVDPSWEDEDARERLHAEVASVGATVAAVDPLAEESADHGPDAPATVGGLPPVDVRVCNPIGFVAESDERYAAVVDVPIDGRVQALLDEAAPAPVEIWPRQARRPLSATELADLRPMRGVVDLPECHDDPVTRARLLAELSAAGVPVLASGLDADVRRLLGAPLTAAVTAATPESLADPVRREQHSIAVRRAALTAHHPETRWTDVRRLLGLPERRARTISILLATNRPRYIAHALEQIRGQDHPAYEVVLGLHGDAFPAGLETQVKNRLGDVPSTIVRASADTRFGDLLNAAADASTGELVTKMDDDDWYGPEHLTDLELAWSYSGASLIGKAAEFVHLSGLGITIRRFVNGAESWNDRVAGGTLLLSRADLAAAGGWRRARRAVDRRLIDDVRAAGGDVYRTHGFGFVLARHDDGHTWDMGLGYFLRQSRMQVRGLALDTAGVRAG
jgi:hypothetical protein